MATSMAAAASASLCDVASAEFSRKMLMMLGLEQNKVVTMEVKPHHPKMAPKTRGHL
jgi:hypothetical protein